MPTSDTHSSGSTSQIALAKDADVLLVEDNLINQKLSRLMLEKRGLKVTIVGNGQEALEVLAEHRFAVLLMDIRMPVMNGLKTIKRIRADPALRSSFVIAISAGILEIEKAQALNVGFDHFLTKPVNYDALQSVLFDTQTTPGFDFSDAIETLGGDPEFFYSLSKDYINIYVNADVTFTNFLKAPDIEQAARLAHNIAGLSATFGAESLRMIARKVEQELRANNEVCEESITTFEEELLNLVAALRVFQNRYTPESQALSS